MAPERRQISEAEKREVLARQGLHCFIDNHPVDSEDELEFDHVHPYSEGGESTVANIAAVCRKHNREKRTLSLGEYRDRIELRRFFEGVKKRRLDDLLSVRLGEGKFGQALDTEITDERSSSSLRRVLELYPCRKIRPRQRSTSSASYPFVTSRMTSSFSRERWNPSGFGSSTVTFAGTHSSHRRYVGSLISKFSCSMDSTRPPHRSGREGHLSIARCTWILMSEE